MASRVASKDMILYMGYLYRQDSLNPSKGDCKYWRCKVKNCRARAKTDEVGNLTVLKPEHLHPPSLPPEFGKKAPEKKVIKGSRKRFFTYFDSSIFIK